MATSGSYLTSQVVNPYTGDGCPDRANISWSATWNASSLLWTVNWAANGAGYYNNNYVTIFSGTVTVTDGNGNTLQTKSMSGQIPYARKDVELVSGSFTVGVDTVGNRNLAFSAVFRIGVNGASGESTGSQTFALDAKPLASTISSLTSNVSVGTSGGASTVNISRNSSSYTHTVKWTFRSYSNTETGVGTSTSYTIPASWLQAMTDAASGSATVTVTTFSGTTQIGNPTTASFTITAAVNPSIGSVSVFPSGNPSGITKYIAGYTKAAISASSVSGVQGSTIKKVEFLNGSTVLSSNTTPSYSYTTGAVTGSSATFGVRVTDSRGRTATKSASAVTIAAYATPNITASAYRSNSSGTAQSDGTYLKVTASATATPSGTGGNSITAVKYSYKATTSSSWSAEANIPSGAVSGFANTTSYDVRVRAQDAIGNSSYKYFTIPTAEYTMDFKVGGKGVAFGKVAETDNLVDSEWDIKAPWFDGNWKYVREVNQADDLNTVIAFGKYAKYSNGSATKPSNCPTDSAFTLYIFSAQGTTEMNGAYKYGVQLIREFSNLNFYFRFMSTDGNGTLSFGSWTKYKMATADITRDTSTMSGVHLQKWEHVVQLSFRGTTINSSGSVGTLPSGYRPIGYMYSAGFYNGDTPAMLVIEADGTTKVYRFNGSSTVLATSGNFNGNVTFLVN